jgi:hypothetical protein
MTSRRRVLGGAAVALSLPFLPSLARGARPPRPRRLLVYHAPNGVHMSAWLPRGKGADYELSPTLEPLAPVRGDVLVLTGLVNSAGVLPVGESVGGHAAGCAGLLTCNQLRRGGLQPAKSVDQVAADALGAATRLPSLELGLADEYSCEAWPCPYNGTISWRGAGIPSPKVTGPRAAFDRLFEGATPDASRADAERRRHLRASVLDTVRRETQAVAARASARDRRKLDEYSTSVRDLERRVQQLAMPPACEVPAPPTETPDDFAAQLDLMHDVMALAFRCDATRVVTFMLGNALGGRNYSFIGAPGNSHGLTHHSGDKAKIEAVMKIDRWRISRLVSLIQKLAAIPDDDEGHSLLHGTCLYYTSEISDGNRHNQDNKPVLIAGQLGGFFRTGQLVACNPAEGPGPFDFGFCNQNIRGGCAAEKAQVGDLYLTILRAMGVRVERFGQTGTRPLHGLGFTALG